MPTNVPTAQIHSGVGSIEHLKANWPQPQQKDEPEEFEIRLCKDCFHCEITDVDGFKSARCRIVRHADYVFGEDENYQCDDAREPESPCGPEGHYWETKD